MKDEKRGRIKTVPSFLAIRGGYQGSHKRKIYEGGSQFREGKVALRTDIYKSSLILIKG